MRPDERDAAYIWDMLDSAKTLQGFITGVSFYNYSQDKKLQSAHPPQSGWLDKWGRLKGGRPVCSTLSNLRISSPFWKLNPACLHALGHISNVEKRIAGFPILLKMGKVFLPFKQSCF
jgi:hypothetical protein